MASLRKYLINNFNAVFVRRVGTEMKKSADELFSITKSAFKDHRSLYEEFNRFVDVYMRFMAVFQTPDYVQILIPEKNPKLSYKFGLVRDYAARFLAKSEIVYRRRLGEILDINPKTALNLLPEEVIKHLQDGRLPADLRRRKTCAILTEKKRTSVLWNGAADKVFYGEYSKFLSKKPLRKIQGISVRKGQVTGRVYVAISEESFKKIPNKAILVTSMTRYTIVPYLHRVSAIVTHQGGMTCHAAIMARELKKPTIVGTRIGTQVFKNGDLVEVDANKGIIKKLT